MNTAKFLAEIKVIENRLRQKAGDRSGRLTLPTLVEKLQREGKINKKIVADFKKLWELRNKVYSTPTPEDSVPDEAQRLLSSLISNSKLQ